MLQWFDVNQQYNTNKSFNLLTNLTSRPTLWRFNAVKSRKIGLEGVLTDI